MSAKTLITVEDFDQLIEPDDMSYELDDGELVAMPKPRPRHNRIAKRILLALERYLESNPIGEALGPENLFVLGPATKRAPGASFLRAERAAAFDPDQDIPGAPDLAVEVLSPNDRAEDIRRKIRQYLTAGAIQVWVVYPQSRLLEVWEGPEKLARVAKSGEVLDGGTLLPGFYLPVDQLFTR